MGRKSKEPEHWFTAQAQPICPLCERPIPDSQADEHHLVPRLKHGKIRRVMHRICHRQIHALFSEAELANRLNTVEALLDEPEIQNFVRWVKTKPPDFYQSSKMSNRKR